jgi:hypothetical protein
MVTATLFLLESHTMHARIKSKMRSKSWADPEVFFIQNTIWPLTADDYNLQLKRMIKYRTFHKLNLVNAYTP